MGIELDDLAEFGFDLSKRSRLTEDMIGHSDLERYPLVYRNGEAHLLLPTAVTASIRRFVIEKMEALGLAGTFAATLAYEPMNMLGYCPTLRCSDNTPVPIWNSAKQIMDCLRV